MRDGGTASGRWETQGGKVVLLAAGFSFSCSFLIRFINFYWLQTAAKTKAGIAELQHWHIGTTAAWWVTLEILQPHRHKAKAYICPRVFYLWLLSSAKEAMAGKLSGKGQQRLITYLFKEERAKDSSASTSHLISVPICFNTVIFFWRKCFIKD